MNQLKNQTIKQANETIHFHGNAFSKQTQSRRKDLLFWTKTSDYTSNLTYVCIQILRSIGLPGGQHIAKFVCSISCSNGSLENGSKTCMVWNLLTKDQPLGHVWNMFGTCRSQRRALSEPLEGIYKHISNRDTCLYTCLSLKGRAYHLI